MLIHKVITIGLLFLSAAARASAPSLVDLDGKPVALDVSSSKDKELVVFWASWCDECRDHLAKELPELNARPDVSVVTVNTDRDNDRVREFVRKEGIHLPVLRDPGKELRSSLHVFSVPHWAVYRRDPGTHQLTLTKSEAAFDMGHVLEALK